MNVITRRELFVLVVIFIHYIQKKQRIRTSTPLLLHLNKAKAEDYVYYKNFILSGYKTLNKKMSF